MYEEMKSNLGVVERDQTRLEADIQELRITLNMLGEAVDRLRFKTETIRVQVPQEAVENLTQLTEVATSPTRGQIRQLNTQATRILQNLSNTTDEIDL